MRVAGRTRRCAAMRIDSSAMPSRSRRACNPRRFRARSQWYRRSVPRTFPPPGQRNMSCQHSSWLTDTLLGPCGGRVLSEFRSPHQRPPRAATARRSPATRSLGRAHRSRTPRSAGPGRLAGYRPSPRRRARAARERPYRSFHDGATCGSVDGAPRASDLRDVGGQRRTRTAPPDAMSLARVFPDPAPVSRRRPTRPLQRSI